MSKSCRRSFKKARKERLKNLNGRFVDNINELRSPAVHKINKSLEMQRLHNLNSLKKLSIFVDLAVRLVRTILWSGSTELFSFDLTSKHSCLHSRPSDLFLYSLADPYRVERLWNAHFKRWFVGFFDKKFLFAGKKSLKALKNASCHLIIIDDT